MAAPGGAGAAPMPAPMLVPDPPPFPAWLAERLDALGLDRAVYGAYIEGLLREEESDEERLEALRAVLAACLEEDLLTDVCREVVERWSDSQVIDAKEEKEGRVLCLGVLCPGPQCGVTCNGICVFDLVGLKLVLPHGGRSDLPLIPLLLSYSFTWHGDEQLHFGLPQHLLLFGFIILKGKGGFLFFFLFCFLVCGVFDLLLVFWHWVFCGGCLVVFWFFFPFLLDFLLFFCLVSCVCVWFFFSV
ncbi:coiled-coil domain-containing protein 43 isoform X1 [Cinclus cinclus]|uniref:coiled-coil domain-containing protein 43 isoform X1 n=1 Tax=Cinclus cinclus TaxID=127875 RepID=UPI002E10C481